MTHGSSCPISRSIDWFPYVALQAVFSMVREKFLFDIPALQITLMLLVRRSAMRCEMLRS